MDDWSVGYVYMDYSSAPFDSRFGRSTSSFGPVLILVAVPSYYIYYYYCYYYYRHISPPFFGATLAFVRHHPVQKDDDKDSEHDHVTHVFARRGV